MNGAIIQARTGSTRLPNKVLLKLQGKSVLEHVVQRVKRSKKIDKVVVATTTKKEDDRIVNICKKLNIDYFCGSEEGVLDRYFQTARLFHIDPIVRITADCPLIDPDIIDKVIDFYYKGKYDYVSNSHPPTFPDGMDVEVFSFKSLQEAWERATLPEERGEFVTVYILRNPQIFKIGNFLNKEDLYSLRLTLDGKKDLILIRKIYKELYKKNKNFSLIEILELFRKRPKLLEINRNEVSHPLSRWGKNQKTL